jgi:hypothetical protein
MSLVVARQVNGEVYIVGDTKFTAHADSGKSQTAQYLGGLKAVILCPGLCVCFAGNVEIARDAIQGIYDTGVNLFEKNLAIEHLLGHHKRSVALGPESETDFIIAVIVQRNDLPGTYEKEVFRIADSKVHWENFATHIGGSNGFERFQQVLHSGVRAAPVPTFESSKLGVNQRSGFDESLSAAMRAMQEVVDDTNVPTVDGIRTVVVSEHDQFKYLEYVLIRGQPVPVRNEPGAPVTFGGAEEGSDSKHVGMFGALGHGIFPVYSYTGRFGVIYHAEQSFEPTICSNCTLDEFQLQVEHRIAAAHQRTLRYQAKFPE